MRYHDFRGDGLHIEYGPHGQYIVTHPDTLNYGIGSTKLDAVSDYYTSLGEYYDIRAHHITTEEQYNAAIEEVDALWEAQPGTPEHLRLVELCDAVEAWEEVHYPIEPPTLWGWLAFEAWRRWEHLCAWWERLTE